MGGKAVSRMMLTLLLIGMLTLAFNIQPVDASGTIYIRADGSIDPPTAPITSMDNVTYTFTDNVYDEIVVERSNITIDGAGYTLQGTGAPSSTGIYLSYISNVTIKNENIKGFDHGIKLWYSSNNIIDQSQITNSVIGILLLHSSNNVISENNIDNNYDVLLWYSSDNNTVSRNNITGANNDGISLCRSFNNAISENNIKSNWVGVHLDESSCNFIYHNNFIGNDWQVYDPSWEHPDFYDPSINFWDDGYPSGGNYWDDYSGVDEYKGSNQDVLGSDGIGDTPYVIDENNTDYYPLMNSWGVLLYELTVTSSPLTGITFTINGVPETTPYTEWLPEGSYTLEMPETHNGYVWSHWLEDGDTSRTKTITLPGTTLTGVFVEAPPPTCVGGEMILIDKTEFIPSPWTSPFTALALVIILATAVLVGYVKHRKQRT